MSQRSTDVCLQCGQSREEVKRNKTFCATVTGYEYVETLDQWDRHHWRDWSNAELRRFGLTPHRWDSNRRTDIYTLLEFEARASHCEREGHRYPKPWHPPMHRDYMDLFPEGLCVVCYEMKDEGRG